MPNREKLIEALEEIMANIGKLLKNAAANELSSDHAEMLEDASNVLGEVVDDLGAESEEDGDEPG